MSKDGRKSVSVWLHPRHQRMLEEMPGVEIADISRRAIEELFEGRNDREYARLYIEERMAELEVEWGKLLGLTVSHTITSTEDGFRIVMAATKSYADSEVNRPVRNPLPVVEDLSSTIEFEDEWED